MLRFSDDGEIGVLRVVGAAADEREGKDGCRKPDEVAASTGPEPDQGIALMRRCRTDELVAALSRLPKVQLRRLLMHAVVRLPVREIARREGCSERAVKYSLARARRRMRALLTDGD
ncbi:sigma factor-like helix-turn-helix DNA-binding protein [Collinsella intestinalis]|uniref:sigma-70 region 4 domain-containing protein n=1 Tax=Collinsella intestinalis TaxID=147207 RepID=UPI00195BD85B|nr:sigma-70 region 4 domain-containing protein [Collinsella intestinalis]MBM6943232.1 sigma-70 region 4 domain-containing protein [Collinsella intestinalis]